MLLQDSILANGFCFSQSDDKFAKQLDDWIEVKPKILSKLMPEVQRELRNMLRRMFSGVKIDMTDLEETMLSELLADGSIKGEKEF